MDRIAPATTARRYPIGAEWSPHGTSFRVWAPERSRVAVVLEDNEGDRALTPQPGGYFHGLVPQARPGTRYRFRLDGSGHLHPDPASRSQPEGPHGPSEVIDPGAFRWSDQAWTGVTLKGQVIYEAHIGTFTPEGTWEAARAKLPLLVDTGITLLEILPVADFPGRFGWGYDGVNLFAPAGIYGTADDFRRFVDTAHGLGLGVILDVVYNHFGPDGNYMREFSPHYFSTRYECEWGDANNFDDENSGPVREFFLANAAAWIEEFHLDGLRLDATQALFDSSEEHIVAAITRTVREAAGSRGVVVIAENEPQTAGYMRPPAQGGYGVDAMWNDDFHHSATVAMTGRNEAYYSDHVGSPQEFVSSAKYGFLFQGQHYTWQGGSRGSPALGIPIRRFVNYLQNHDQVANSGRGERFQETTSPGRARAMTALLLLMPTTPLLFQGQEFWATTRFHYFADHNRELSALIRKGRAEFVRQFPSLASPDMQMRLPDPGSAEIFDCCKLDWSERDKHSEAVQLHRDLLRLRREDPVFAAQRDGGIDGAVFGDEAFVLRFFGETEGDDRLVVVNLGLDLSLRSMAEPLIAPPPYKQWRPVWSSEHPDYGGLGVSADFSARWKIQGRSTVVLKAEETDG